MCKHQNHGHGHDDEEGTTPLAGATVYGFGGLGVRALGFRGLGFRGLGFRV